LGKFRFEVENNFKQYIQKIRDYMKADDKISAMGVSGVDGIDYGYRVTDDENRNRYGRAEKNTKKLLRESDILESFKAKMRFMARNGRHSVLERPLYGAKRPQVSY
jgi:hypothetical protein